MEMLKNFISYSSRVLRWCRDRGFTFFKGNKTAYINALIKKDLEENLEKYKEFKDMVKRK